MLDYITKSEMYEWFRLSQGWNRMDFLCSLIRFCNPFELRFLGSCIEDKAQMDYNCLRDQEIKANSAENLDQFIGKCPHVDEFRSHISICLSLLQSSNYKVARKLAELLEEKLEGLNLEHLMQAGLDAEVEQWMLILTLASYHPAFSFEKKVNFKEKLSEYERLNKRVRKSSRCWSHRPHRCLQQQHSVTNYSNSDDASWRTDYNPPFQHYPMYQNSYGYQNCPYAGKPQPGNMTSPEHFMGSTNFVQRPSTFPSTLMPPSGMGDTNFFEKPSQEYRQASDFAQNIEYSSGYSTKIQKTEQRSMLGVVLPPTGSINYAEQNYIGVIKNSQNVLPVTSNDTELGSVFSPTLPTVHTECCSSTNSVSTVTTATSDPGIVQRSSTQSSEFMSRLNENHTGTSSDNLFIPISNSQSNDLDSEYIPNRVLHETENLSSEFTEEFNNNNDMQKDNILRAIEKQSSKQSETFTNNNVRTSVSMPLLDRNTNMKTAEPFSLSEHDFSNLRNKIVFSRPVKVSVRIVTRNKKADNRTKNGTYFKLKVEWSDGATSECEKTIEEMLKFYKQMSGKLKKSSLNTDFLMRQQNQVEEKREKLEEIFREILSTLSTSVSEDVISFFKFTNNYTQNPSSSLPLKKRKFKQGSKYRSGTDCNSSSSSSSSTSSPPLSNNNLRHKLVPTEKDIQRDSDSTLPKIAVVSNANTIEYRDCDASGDNCESTSTNTYKSNSQVSSDGSMKPLETDLKGLNLAADCDNKGGRPLDVRSLPDDISRTRSEDERSGSSQTVPFEIPDASDSIQAMASRSCFSFEFDSSAATVESHGRLSQKSSENEMDLPNDKEVNTPFGKAEFFYTKNVFDPPGKAWSQTDIAPSTEFLQTVPTFYFPSKSAPPFHQMPYYARVHPDSLASGSQVVQMLGCYHAPPHVIHPSTTPVSVAPPMFTRVATIPSPMGHKQPQYTYTVATTSDPTTPTQNIGYMPTDKMVLNGVPIGPATCYYTHVPKLQTGPTSLYQANQLQHNPVGATYSDPLSYPTKKLDVTSNDFSNYHPNPEPNVPGSGLPNGYPETGKHYMGLNEHPQMLNRVHPNAQDYRGDVEEKQATISCYNCGKKGHDASLCSEPNAGEILGLDFHLKMSQPSNRKGND